MPNMFVKMQGAGNDYIYIPACRLPDDPAAVARRLSDRHYGVGADGVVWILPHAEADVAMRMFNADGSEGRLCGNALRCIGRYCFSRGIGGVNTVTVMTGAGLRRVRQNDKGRITAEIGTATVLPVVEETVDGTTYPIIPVDVGNPHGVIFTDDLSDSAVTAIGKTIARRRDCNVELVKIIDNNHIRMRVWERGSGVTLACGTGCCAAASAAVQRHCRFPLAVQTDGGVLTVTEQDSRLWLTGDATIVFEGVIANEG